jgi:hypothetical protein
MEYKSLENLVKNYKTVNKKGFTDSEIKELIKKQNIESKKFYQILGANTCLIINGEVVTYKKDILNALSKYYELGGFFD